MRSKARQKIITEAFQAAFRKVIIVVTRRHQMSNEAKFCISSEMSIISETILDRRPWKKELDSS